MSGPPDSSAGGDGTTTQGVILASVAAVRSGPRPGRRTPEDLLPPAP
ncbi:hypothetical protein [Kocuria rhizophila]|nr:hypothetical protein [Kocuria rhizophila]